VGPGSDFFGNSLFIHPNNIQLIEAEFSLPIIWKLLPAILSLSGALLAVILYQFNPEFINSITESFKKTYTFLNGKYFFDIIYNEYFIGKGFKIGNQVSKILDKGIVELVGPWGFSNILNNTGGKISKMDTGIITSYALYIVLALITLLLLLFAPILIDTSLISEMRLFIIYLTTLIITLW